MIGIHLSIVAAANALRWREARTRDADLSSRERDAAVQSARREAEVAVEGARSDVSLAAERERSLQREVVELRAAAMAASEREQSMSRRVEDGGRALGSGWLRQILYVLRHSGSVGGRSLQEKEMCQEPVQLY